MTDIVGTPGVYIVTARIKDFGTHTVRVTALDVEDAIDIFRNKHLYKAKLLGITSVCWAHAARRDEDAAYRSAGESA